MSLVSGVKIAAWSVFVQESVAAAASHGGEVRARANGGKGSVRLAQEPAGAGVGRASSAAVLRSHAERAHGVHRGRHARVCPGELCGRAAWLPTGRVCSTTTWL